MICDICTGRHDTTVCPHAARAAAECEDLRPARRPVERHTPRIWIGDQGRDHEAMARRSAARAELQRLNDRNRRQRA